MKFTGGEQVFGCTPKKKELVDYFYTKKIFEKEKIKTRARMAVEKESLQKDAKKNHHKTQKPKNKKRK